MSKQIRLKELSELQQLLPESGRSKPAAPMKHNHDGKRKIVRVSRDTKDRKGKVVTIISGFQHNPDTMGEIARTLKQYCGAGGTVKGMTIEIQGDQRERVTEKFGEMNYVVK
ncbi:MAG: translation initiation factor [Ignavibacteriae bacterium]|nr:translation initiation factor [Ignavibacteriota bacterium]